MANERLEKLVELRDEITKLKEQIDILSNMSFRGVCAKNIKINIAHVGDVEIEPYDELIMTIVNSLRTKLENLENRFYEE
jgi:hypothetical protein